MKNINTILNQVNRTLNSIVTNQKGESAELIVKGIASLILKSAGAILGLCTFIYFSRQLDSNDYGIYVTIVSIASFVSFILASGGHLSSLRRDFLSKNNKLNNIYVSSLYIITLFSFVVFIFTASIVYISTDNNSLLLSYTLYASFLSIGLALIEIQSALLRSYKEVISSLGAKDILWRLLSILIFWVASMYTTTIDAMFAYITTVVALYLVLILQFTYFISKYKYSFSPRLRYSIALFKGNMWLSAAAVSNNLLPQLSVIAVSAVLSYTVAGAFFSSQRIVLILALPIVSANIIGAPLISKAWRKRDIYQVQTLCNIVSLSSFFLTVFGISFIYLFGETMLSVFNSDYGAYYDVLLILSLGSAINAFSGPTGYLMLMTGHERTFVLILAVTQSLGLAAVFIGSTLASAAGAAIGEVLGAIAWNACVIVWSRKTLGVDPSLLGALRKPTIGGV